MTNEELNARINELWMATKRGKLPRQARFAAIEQLTEEYMAATGRRPDPAMLDRLATLCLYEEITDPHPDKMARDEYPIMSDTQEEERHDDEVSLKWAESVATDGRDYAKQTREYRRKLRNL
ncbi:hypothetical protein [Heyndrickxia coagulans]|uniref:hypothetical protein n=1 Tax=Heyndrickxia coagulans TaxID=1398 RepID=UPI0007793260|nr:hypothetical protein [Heyndrickxia coagulans]KYC67186.1 hypothetical protein B4100_3822 [Heyndrickxia coagulans]